MVYCIACVMGPSNYSDLGPLSLNPALRMTVTSFVRIFGIGNLWPNEQLMNCGKEKVRWA